MIKITQDKRLVKSRVGKNFNSAPMHAGLKNIKRKVRGEDIFPSQRTQRPQRERIIFAFISVNSAFSALKDTVFSALEVPFDMGL